MICPSRRCSNVIFFSSRRRHTRFDCDWSSDVCSSDLTQAWARLLSQSTAAPPDPTAFWRPRSEEHTSELQSQSNIVCRLLLEKKNPPTPPPPQPPPTTTSSSCFRPPPPASRSRCSWST